jgi:predicted DNA-binding transcriptional regulator YafY
MAGDPLERLTNLVARLVHSPRPLTQSEIVAEVPGYTPGEAGRRAFERDKRLLRDQGVPLHEEAGRYSISPDEFFLPELDLTDEERAALAISIAAVPVGAHAAYDALGKLGGFGVGALSTGVADALPHADLEELPALPLLHAAARRRAVVEFSYRGDARAVEPYGVLFFERFWYLAGFDLGRQGPRRFRVDRIDGEVTVGPAGAFERPADLDVKSMLPELEWRSAVDEGVDALVAVDRVVAGKVVAELGETARVREDADGRTVLRMRVSNRALFRSWLLALLDHAEVLEPPALRGEIVEWLTAIARTDA